MKRIGRSDNFSFEYDVRRYCLIMYDRAWFDRAWEALWIGLDFNHERDDILKERT